MKTFNDYLNDTQEIGFVAQVMDSIIYAHGLPNLHPGCMVMFESGELGYAMGIHPDYAEIMMLSPNRVPIGTRIARLQTPLKIKVGAQQLGTILHSQDFQKTIFDLEDLNNTVDLDCAKTTHYPEEPSVSTADSGSIPEVAVTLDSKSKTETQPEPRPEAQITTPPPASVVPKTKPKLKVQAETKARPRTKTKT